MKYNFSPKAVLFSALILAVFLRLLGIWHGYPYSFYPDEAHFVKRALSFGSGDLNPHWFHKPAFFMYILFVEYGCLFVFGKVAGFWSSAQDFAVSYIVNPGPFYLLGRLTVAAFSVATIFIIYQIGERHFKRYVGATAALLFSLSVGAISASQDIKADIPAMFFNFLSVYFLMEYLSKEKIKLIVLACIFAGVAAATKYYGYVMLVPIYLSIFLVEIIRKNKYFNIKILFISGIYPIVIFYFAFFICSPFNFLDPLGRQATFGKLLDVYNTMASLSGVLEIKVLPEFLEYKLSRVESFIDYINVIISVKGMGLVIGIMSILGSIFVLLKFNLKLYIFLLFPLVLILVSTVVYPGYAETRHQIPIYPFLVLCAAYLVVHVSDKLGKRAVIGLLIIMLLSPLASALQRGFYVSKEDTRNLSKHWIEENIPQGAKLIVDEYGPVLFQDREQLLGLKEKAENADQSGQFTAHYSKYIDLLLGASDEVKTYYLQEVRFPWWKASEDEFNEEYDMDMANPLKSIELKSLRSYYDDGYSIVVLSSERYNPFLNPDTPRYKNFPTFRIFYHEVFEKGKLLKEFNPDDGDRPGPTIKIFKLDFTQ